MSASPQFAQYIVDTLAPLGPLRSGRFFGGIAISCGSVQFAMVMGNRLYFAVNDHTLGKYEQAGMQAFSYLTKRGRIQVRKYFEIPSDLLEDTAQLHAWAREAMGAARKT